MQSMPLELPEFPKLAAGEVWLVGAGPGDPRLLTLMAAHALRSAEAIVHDALIDMRILSLASDGARLYPAGKRGGKPSAQQSDITERVIALASEGRKVVRLKGGDPFVFGRGGEEARALARAGITYRIVPGLTSGLSAAALAGIPATTRETNHAVILATGHRAPGEDSVRDWEAIARTGQPVIFYMAMARLEEITHAFLRVGTHPDTPVTIIASATYSNERIVETRIASACVDAQASDIEPPAIVIIGNITGLRPELSATLIGAD